MPGGAGIIGSPDLGEEARYDSAKAIAGRNAVRTFDLRADLTAAIAEFGEPQTESDVGRISDSLVSRYQDRLTSRGVPVDENWQLLLGAVCEAP